MQGGELREMEWAPPTETAPLFFTWEDPPEEYGPWKCAGEAGRASGRFTADAFVLQENRRLRCPAGASLNFGRSASRERVYESVPSTSLTRPIVSHILCESSV